MSEGILLFFIYLFFFLITGVSGSLNLETNKVIILPKEKFEVSEDGDVTVENS
jgi:hypothetical protein